MGIPKWLEKTQANEEDICTECYKDFKEDEECYKNKNGVKWCNDCAELAEE